MMRPTRHFSHRSRIPALFSLLLALALSVQAAVAAPVTVIRDYTYHAGDADSKLTCRTIALEQVKRLLLEELGTYLVSSTVVKDSALTKDEIVTYTAGAVVTVVLEERWDGTDYFMKARITTDIDEVAKAVASLHDDHEKAAELAQLRSQANDSLKEIDRLRKELARATAAGALQGDADVAAVQDNYNRAVAKLGAKDYLERGIGLRKSGTLTEAIDAFGKAIACAPSWYRPYLTRGAAYLMVDDPDRALVDLEQALLLAPGDLTSISLHGITFLKLGRKKDGIAELRRVAAASANDVTTYDSIGAILIKYDMPDDALTFLAHSLSLHQDDQGRAHYLSAQAYNKLGNKQKAMDELRKAAREGNAPARELLK